MLRDDRVSHRIMMVWVLEPVRIALLAHAFAGATIECSDEMRSVF